MSIQREILIVEEERSLALMKSLFLEKNGYTPIITDSGLEAIDILRKEKISAVLLCSKTKDLKTTDIMHIIKSDSALSNIPILFITSKNKHREICDKLSIEEYYKKPVIMYDIIEKLNEITCRNIN